MTEFVNTRGAAEFLSGLGIKISNRTLEELRSEGCGPAYVKLGGAKRKRAPVVYPVSSLRKWLDDSLRTSTHEQAPRGRVSRQAA